MDSLLALLLQHGTLLVFASTLAARIGLPVPAAPVVVVAGALSVGGGIGFWAMTLAAVIANLLGDAAWFVGGRRYGHRVMRLLCRLSLSPDSCVRQSENFIGRWGGGALIAAKFVPGVSTIAAPMAGALGMSTARFVAFDLLGAAVWTFAFALLGVVFSRDIRAVLDTLASVGLLTGGALMVALLGYLAIRWVRRRSVLMALAAPRITVGELRALFEQGRAPTVIDVRSPSSLLLDPRRVPGALPIELRMIAARARELPADAIVVLYCNCPNEVSAAQAARLLGKAGVANSRVLEGGLDAWVAEGAMVETHADLAGAPRAGTPSTS
jgi:membrane protein DedA with SNARE-associated domain/rhodanese-related sulfurtransferase